MFTVLTTYILQLYEKVHCQNKSRIERLKLYYYFVSPSPQYSHQSQRWNCRFEFHPLKYNSYFLYRLKYLGTPLPCLPLYWFSDSCLEICLNTFLNFPSLFLSYLFLTSCMVLEFPSFVRFVTTF